MTLAIAFPADRLDYRQPPDRGAAFGARDPSPELLMRLRSRILAGFVLTLTIGLLPWASEGDGVVPGDRAPHRALHAQSAPLAYEVVATWEGIATALPADAWRRATGLALGASGSIYVVDATDGRNSVIAPDESERALAPTADGGSGLRDAVHLAVDEARDRIYVTDGTRGEVAVFDLAGERVATWGNVLEAAGVAVAPDGWVAAGSAETGEVVLFDVDGTERLRFKTSTTTQTGGLVRGIDIDEDGRIHVLDGTSQTLRVFNEAGRRTSQTALRIPESIEIRDVAVDYEQGLTSSRRIRFATSIGIFTYKPSSDDYDILPRGDLHALDVSTAVGSVASQPATRRNEGSLVLRFAYATITSAAPTTVWGRSVAVPGTFDQPEIVAIGADGLALVLDRAWRVQRFAADGAVVGQLDPPGLSLNPVSATSAPDGRVFVTDGGIVAGFDAAGTEVWQQTVAAGGGEGNAVALAWDQASDLLMALDTLGDTLHRFDADGTRLSSIPLQAAPDGSTIWGDLDVRDGRAYVLDRINRAVRVVEPAGPGGWTQRTIALPARARRIAAAPDGAVLTLERDGWVRRVADDGAPAGAFDATRFDLAFASAPSDLAVDDAGQVLVSDRSANVVTRFAPDPDPGAVPPEPPGDRAACRTFPDKTAAPDTIELGDTVEVRLTVRGGCGSTVSSEPRDVILVLDRSGSMQGEPIRVLREAALAFLADVDFTTTRVGVVAFNETVQRTPLSANPAPVRSAIRGLQASGQTLLHVGLAEARSEFQQRGRADARPVLILFSDGQDTGSDTKDTEREARFLKTGMGVEIFTIGIQASPTLLRQVATDEDHYYAAGNARFLYGIFERIAQRVTSTTLFRSLVIEDELPADMELLPGSAEPPPMVQGRLLRWTLVDVPLNGLGLRYTVRPTTPGDRPTNVFARGTFEDGFGNPGTFDFPVPIVRVIVDTPTPTATSTPTPTATPTATATATATPIPVPIFLPLALHERTCKPGERHADVMLVVDTSSSMVGPKIVAARAAARQFIDLLDLPRDQVGVVRFDSEARLVAPLSGDATSLRAAIDGLATASGTRIDLGLRRALDELASGNARAGNTPTLVLLTDGRMPDPDAALGIAAEARAAGVRLYAIGLGDESQVDFVVLVRLAGDRSRAFLAPRPEDLTGIYAQVAGEVPCPPDVYWGRRVIGRP